MTAVFCWGERAMAGLVLVKGLQGHSPSCFLNPWVSGTQDPQFKLGVVCFEVHCLHGGYKLCE